MTYSPKAFFFDDSTWNEYQYLSVESRDDQIYHRLTYSTSIEINAESVDSAYKALRPFVLPVYIEEDDIPGISISEAELTLFENSGVGKSDAVYSVVP